MKFIARYVAGSPEIPDGGSQGLLLKFQLFVLRCGAGVSREVLFYQCRDGSVLFGGLHAGAAIGFIVHRYCDIFHIFTVSQESSPVHGVGNTMPVRGVTCHNTPIRGGRPCLSIFLFCSLQKDKFPI